MVSRWAISNATIVDAACIVATFQEVMMFQLARCVRCSVVRLPLLLLPLTGCGGGQRDLNDVERLVLSQQDAVERLKSKGGLATEKVYPLGAAWIVKLAGANVDEEVVGILTSLNRIAELDLSGAKITDEQMKQIAETAGGVLYKLDISKTELTDATMDVLADRVLLGEVVAAGSKITPGGVNRFRSKRNGNSNVRIKNTVIKL